MDMGSTMLYEPPIFLIIIQSWTSLTHVYQYHCGFHIINSMILFLYGTFLIFICFKKLAI